MDILTIIGILVLVIILLSLGRILSFALKFLFYALLIVLLIMIFFGVPFEQILNTVTSAMLWAF